MTIKFPLGRTIITTSAVERLTNEDLQEALARHAAGDWGEVCREDLQENELSLEKGFRLLSVYRSKAGEKFWVLTEADRSATTVLMPEDY